MRNRNTSTIPYRLYSWLLRAYPSDFREDCGQEMLDTLRIREAAARSAASPMAGGALRMARFWLRELLSVLRTAISQRWKRHHASGTSRPDRSIRAPRRAGAGSILQDLRFATRTLRKRPLFTAIAVGTLGLGVGATTAIFSVVEGVLLRELPYERPGELVQVWTTFPEWEGRGGPISDLWDRFYFSYPDFDQWRDGQTVYQDVALYNFNTLTLTGTGTPERISAGVATASLFPLLGVRPVVGRAFLPGEDGPGAQRVALLSYDFWQERFSGDRDILGESIALSDESFTIIGILPRGFRLRSIGNPEASGDRPIWIPVGTGYDPMTRGLHNFEAVGRLQPGVTLAHAQEETAALVRGELDPSERGARLIPRDEAETAGLGRPLYLLLGASLVLLLIASGNVATLLLAEFTGRRHEMATRTALGAGKGRIVRQLLTESVLLGVVGSGLGIVLAVTGTRALVSMAPPFPRLDELGVDGTVLLFAVGVGILTGLLFGLAPSIDLSGSRTQETLRSGRRQSRRSESFFQHSVVSAEIALTLVLLVSGGLLLRSLSTLFAVDPGFRPEQLVEIPVVLERGIFPAPQERVGIRRQIRVALESLPGVESVSATTSLPFAGRSTTYTFRKVGEEWGEDVPEPPVQRRDVMPGYVETLGIPLLAGRTIEAGDREGALPVAVISESMARDYWRDDSAIGSRIVINDTLTVVGIVGDVLHESMDANIRPTVYVATAQSSPSGVSFVIRTSGNPTGLFPLMREAIWSVVPSLPISRVTRVTSLMSDTAADERFRTTLMMLFGVCAALLAGAGVFGVTSRSVARRTREMGIRMALGAKEEGLVRSMVTSGIPSGMIGIGVGLVGALWASRLLGQYLFGVTTWDPLTYAVVIAGLGGLSVLASYLPARRVSKVAPMDVLREE